jgi:hypothetical protein
LHLNISDFKTALVGSFVDGVLEHAQEARLKTVVDDAGVKVSFEIFLFSFLCFVVVVFLSLVDTKHGCSLNEGLDNSSEARFCAYK